MNTTNRLTWTDSTDECGYVTHATAGARIIVGPPGTVNAGPHLYLPCFSQTTMHSTVAAAKAYARKALADGAARGVVL